MDSRRLRGRGASSTTATSSLVEIDRRHCLRVDPFSPRSGPCLRCATLHDACLHLGPPQPRCSRKCEIRPFRLDVHGTRARSEVDHANTALRLLKDPLDSFKLRNLSRDVHVSYSPLPLAPSAPQLHMIWPRHELSHGDFVRDTLLTLGHLLASEQMPAGTLAFSGIAAAAAAAGLTARRSVCTFERREPTLPRCPRSACYGAVHLCEVGRIRPGAQTLRAMGSLDEGLGLPPAHHDPPAVAAAGASTLRVLLARRQRRRLLSNVDALLGECRRAARVDGYRVECVAASLGAMNMSEAARAVRAADVLVSMHGGDVIHGLHLLPGRAVVEVVNYGFRYAPETWLDQYKRVLEPSLRHVRAVLAPQVDPAAGRIVNQAWNAAGTLPWEQLERALRAVARGNGDRTTMIGAATPRAGSAAASRLQRWVDFYADVNAKEAATRAAALAARGKAKGLGGKAKSRGGTGGGKAKGRAAHRARPADRTS